MSALWLFTLLILITVLSTSEAMDLTQEVKVQSLHDNVYTSLGNYIKSRKPNDPGRYVKLLHLVPIIRKVGYDSEWFILQCHRNDIGDFEQLTQKMRDPSLKPTWN